jgi:hypothetical protein
LPEVRYSAKNEKLSSKVLNSYSKMKEKASKRDSRRKLGSCRWTPKVNDNELVKTTHVGRHKKTSKFVIVRGSIYYFINISPVRLWAEGLEVKGKRKIQQESFKAT